MLQTCIEVDRGDQRSSRSVRPKVEVRVGVSLTLGDVALRVPGTLKILGKVNVMAQNHLLII